MAERCVTKIKVNARENQITSLSVRFEGGNTTGYHIAELSTDKPMCDCMAHTNGMQCRHIKFAQQLFHIIQQQLNTVK